MLPLKLPMHGRPAGLLGDRGCPSRRLLLLEVLLELFLLLLLQFLLLPERSCLREIALASVRASAYSHSRLHGS